MLQVVLPALKERLAAAAPARFGPRAPPTRFFYQLPPTIRLQPGPSQRCVRAHSDSAYGHQPGELNCWMPLTSPARTRTTLWLESAAGAGDYAALDVGPGVIGVFHGTSVRHHVPPNPSCCMRVSLDFRVGVGGCYDPEWEYMGHSMAHVRRQHDVPWAQPVRDQGVATTTARGGVES